MANVRRKPKYVNHCEHDESSFVDHFKGRDVYFYMEKDGAFGIHWHFCTRYGNEPEDYSSGPYRVFLAAPTVFPDDLSAETKINYYKGEQIMF